MISIGTIGLIKGITTFDASKGARLATYAARCVENEILMYFRGQKKSAQDVSLSDAEVIGELQLKQIDRDRKECTLSIHMQNDSVKGKGYGTQAEKLAIKYAFEKLGMLAVNADAVLKNTRSQHVLEKVGFRFVKEEGIFRYYRVEQADFHAD